MHLGEAMGPQGTLFHSTVGTWQQSPQELFRGGKLYQSQAAALHAHLNTFNRTFKARWISPPLLRSATSCFSCVFHSSPDEHGDVGALTKTSQNISVWLDKRTKKQEINYNNYPEYSLHCLSIASMSRLSQECTMRCCLCLTEARQRQKTPHP